MSNDLAGAHHEVDLAGTGVGDVDHEILGGCLATLGFVAAPAVAANAVGTTATMPAAATVLRATFKKPLREMSCITTPPSRPTSVDRLRTRSKGSLDRFDKYGTEDYSQPSRPRMSEFEDFSEKVDEVRRRFEAPSV